MRGVVGLLRPSEVLGGQKLKVVTNREHLFLGVKVVDGCGIVTTSYKPESAVFGPSGGGGWTTCCIEDR